MRRWAAVAFLMVFMGINFADKAVLGLAARPIIDDFHLSHAQFGALGSSFFCLFSLSALTVGWLGDRLDPKRLLAGMALLWTLAQIAVGGAATFGLLLASRVLLGGGEGPAYPTAVHVAYGGAPEEQRPRISGFILSGAALGTALAALLLPRVIAQHGWQFAFAILGIGSFLWALSWLAFSWRSASPPRERVALGMKALLANRTMVGVMLATFAAYWVNSLAIVWFPGFLERGAGFSATSAGRLLAVAYGLQVPMFVIAGFTAEAAVRRTRSRGATYRVFGAAALACAGLAFVSLAFTTSPALTALCVVLSLTGAVFEFIVATPIVAEVAPEAHRSAALGALVAVYALAGFAAPLVFGAIVDGAVDPAVGFRHAFLASGVGIALVGALAYYLIRPEADRRVLGVEGITA